MKKNSPVTGVSADVLSIIPEVVRNSWGYKFPSNINQGVRFKTSGLVSWKGYVDLVRAGDFYTVTFFRIKKIEGVTRELIDYKIQDVDGDQAVEIIDRYVMGSEYEELY